MLNGLPAPFVRRGRSHMDHKTFFLTHWDKEAAATRKVISRIPQSHVDYRSDRKHARPGSSRG